MKAAAGRGGHGGQGDRPGAFPWDVVMHVGLCLLRLPPVDFWRLTPVEFFTMAGGTRPAVVAIERDGLEALMQAFPDG